MGISSVTTLKCDFAKCDKVFYLYDDESKNTPGMETTFRVTDAFGDTKFYCSKLHELADGAEIIKKAPKQPGPQLISEPEDLSLRDL